MRKLAELDPGAKANIAFDRSLIIFSFTSSIESIVQAINRIKVDQDNALHQTEQALTEKEEGFSAEDYRSARETMVKDLTSRLRVFVSQYPELFASDTETKRELREIFALIVGDEPLKNELMEIIRELPKSQDQATSLPAEAEVRQELVDDVESLKESLANALSTLTTNDLSKSAISALDLQDLEPTHQVITQELTLESVDSILQSIESLFIAFWQKWGPQITNVEINFAEEEISDLVFKFVQEGMYQSTYAHIIRRLYKNRNKFCNPSRLIATPPSAGV